MPPSGSRTATDQLYLPRIMMPSMSAWPPTWVFSAPSSENARARSLLCSAMLAPLHARVRVSAGHLALGAVAADARRAGVHEHERRRGPRQLEHPVRHVADLPLRAVAA